MLLHLTWPIDSVSFVATTPQPLLELQAKPQVPTTNCSRSLRAAAPKAWVKMSKICSDLCWFERAVAGSWFVLGAFTAWAPPIHARLLLCTRVAGNGGKKHASHLGAALATRCQPRQPPT